MSQRDLFGGQPSNYCLPPDVGASGQVLTAQNPPPSSGPNFLAWTTPPAEGQYPELTGASLTLTPVGGGGTGSIAGTFDLYTSGYVTTALVTFSGQCTFDSAGGTLTTSDTGPFGNFAPNNVIWGSILGTGAVTDNISCIMGWSVDSYGDLVIYPMYGAGTHTISLDSVTLIWDYVPVAARGALAATATTPAPHDTWTEVLRDQESVTTALSRSGSDSSLATAGSYEDLVSSLAIEAAGDAAGDTTPVPAAEFAATPVASVPATPTPKPRLAAVRQHLAAGTD